MNVARVPAAHCLSTVAALLLGVAACGSPANNSALFAASRAPAVGSGTGGAGNAPAGGTGQTSAAGSGNTSSSGVGNGGSSTTAAGSGGALASGGGAAGEPNAGGAPNGGAPQGGTPDGGTAGAPSGGSAVGGSGGGTLGDCSAYGSGATYYSATKHCYLAVRDLATFADAQTHCSGLGGHLVTLSDQPENDFVWSLDTNEHWIGATDGKGLGQPTPGTYAWIDGEPFSYTDWSQGQPNATASTCPDGTSGGTCYEHCGFQWSGGAMAGEWNDRLCSHTIEAVCEWDH